MKRTGIKPGAKATARGSTFEKRTAGLRRPAGKARANSRAGHRDWVAFVTGKPCALCGNPAAHGHHVIYKQHLLREQLDHLAWDLRNCLPLCVRCHHRHHLAVERVPWARLRLENLEFAREIGLWWLLRREYPRPEQNVTT